LALPYLQSPVALEPRIIGNAATGTLEVPLLGYLTVQESDTIADLVAADESVFTAGAKIASQIAAEAEISLSEAFKIVEDSVAGRVMEPDADAIRLAHAARIETVAQLYSSIGRRNTTAAATAIIRHRLFQPTWGIADTQALPNALREALYQIVADEQQSEREPIKPPSEAELKKPPLVNGKRSKPIGNPSSLI
jgi:hypothetical protein